MQIRAFCNHDPPALVQLWRRLGPLRARAQTLNIATLERLILSKPYFDREGLLIAHNNDREYLGFVHAAFGSQSDGSGLEHEILRGRPTLVRLRARPDDIDLIEDLSRSVEDGC